MYSVSFMREPFGTPVNNLEIDVELEHVMRTSIKFFELARCIAVPRVGTALLWCGQE